MVWAQTTRCKFCRAEIEWRRGPRGWIPLDPAEPDLDRAEGLCLLHADGTVTIYPSAASCGAMLLTRDGAQRRRHDCPNRPERNGS